MNDLQREATDPRTSPLRLQELAKHHTALRPLIALNPSTYPGLVQWLEGLEDPAVKMALSQRRAAQASSADGNQGARPSRVSVYKRPSGDTGPKSPVDGIRTTDAGAPPLPVDDHSSPVNAANAENPTIPTDSANGTHPASPTGLTNANGATGSSANPTGSHGAAGETPNRQPAQPSHAKAGPPALGATAAKPLPENYQVHPTVRTGSIPQQDPGDDRRRLLVIVLLLVFIAATLVFAVVYLFRPVDNPVAEGDSELETVEDEQKGEGSVVDEDSDDAEDSGEDDPAVERFPAPDGSLSFDHFMAPSGNIACELKEEQATCTIMSHEFRDPTLSTCGTGPLSVTLTEEKAYLDCGVAPVSTTGAATLSYSDYSSSGQFACMSTMNGMSCWNKVTGASFAVARQGYVVGNEPIEENGFPWSQ